MPERTVFKISGSSIKPTEQPDNFLNTQKAAAGNPTKRATSTHALKNRNEKTRFKFLAGKSNL